MDQVRLKDCLPSEILTQSSSLNLSGSTRQQVKDISTSILPAYCVIKPSSVSTAEEVPLADYELPLSKAEILQSGMVYCYHVHVYTMCL